MSKREDILGKSANDYVDKQMLKTAFGIYLGSFIILYLFLSLF